jgi:hypothetical protein
MQRSIRGVVKIFLEGFFLVDMFILRIPFAAAPLVSSSVIRLRFTLQ